MLIRPIRLASLLVLVNGSLLFLAGICASGSASAQGSAAGQDPAAAANLTIDYATRGKPLTPIWAYFGYDEPNYTYMKDGRKLLTEISALSPVPVYVRCHNLLTSGDGVAAMKWGSTNAYTEDANGRPVYSWHIVDSIIDTYIKRHMKPLVEIGFTPEALSTHPQPYRHHWKPGVRYDSIYTGWAYPPNDYKKWGELVYQWVKHSIARYGEREVNTWLWEVWNEPNIAYWKGTPQEYNMLYDYAADGLKRALPSARIGGPGSTGPSWNRAEAWLRDFLTHCSEGTNAATGTKGAPLDFISFHAKGSPRVVNGHVRMSMAGQLTDVAKGFAVVKASAYPNLPIYITECDPEGCAACGMTTNPENAYRNGTMYSSYTASSFARIYDLAAQYQANLAGATSWSFEFEDQKWFDGFRDLATNGVDKPVLNVFRMYGMMMGNRIPVKNEHAILLDSMLRRSVHGADPDINALATAGKRQVAVMVWNYHDDDLPGETARVNLLLQHIPTAKATVEQYRIDEEHSNSYEVWKKMGSPQSVSDDQYKVLEQAGHLQSIGQRSTLPVAQGDATVKVDLPRHAVALFIIKW